MAHKITIFLEETKLDYRIHPIDILKGDQFDSEFLKISPNNKMPAIVDTEPEDERALSLFESGAILRYLAQKTERFILKEFEKPGCGAVAHLAGCPLRSNVGTESSF